MDKTKLRKVVWTLRSFIGLTFPRTDSPVLARRGCIVDARAPISCSREILSSWPQRRCAAAPQRGKGADTLSALALHIGRRGRGSLLALPRAVRPELRTSTAEHYLVRLDVPGARLEGQLAIPARASGVVVFSHEADSRHSPRTKSIAQALREDARAATLLIDLLSPPEEASDARSAELRFDVDALARRVLALCEHVASEARTQGLPIGIFGTGTGTAAAITAAVQRPDLVHAIVSRSGRPDLAGPSTLVRARAPTLFVVGERDTVGLELNQQARRVMRCETALYVVEGAAHRFDEPGTEGDVARHAAAWFRAHLRRS
jgi:dienelactone hydrolase